MILPALPDPQRLALFVVTALVVLVTPGPAVFYILARSMADGLRAGIASAVGMTLGGMIHLALLLAGFAAVVVEYPGVRDAVALAGSAFLIYLGVLRLRNKTQSAAAEETGTTGTPGITSRSVILDAAVVNVLNPKAIIFLLAFLPQFAVGDTPAELQGQLLGYGIVFVSLGLTTDLVYAFAASGVRRAFISRPERMRVVQRLSGAVLASLGLFGIGQLLVAN